MEKGDNKEILYALTGRVTVKDRSFAALEKMRLSGDTAGLLSFSAERSKEKNGRPADLQHIYRLVVGDYGEEPLAKDSRGAVTFYSSNQNPETAEYSFYATMTPERLRDYVMENGGMDFVRKEEPFVSGNVFSVVNETAEFEDSLVREFGRDFDWKADKPLGIAYNGGRYVFGELRITDGSVFIDSDPHTTDERGWRRPKAYNSLFTKAEWQSFIKDIVPRIKADIARQEKKKETMTMENKTATDMDNTERNLYKYTIMDRQTAGSRPQDGLVSAVAAEENTKGQGYGKLVYDRRLSDKEVSQHGLRPDTELNNLVGRVMIYTKDGIPDIAVSVDGYGEGSDRENPQTLRLTTGSLQGDFPPQKGEEKWNYVIETMHKPGYSLVPKGEEKKFTDLMYSGWNGEEEDDTLEEGLVSEPVPEPRKEKEMPFNVVAYGTGSDRTVLASVDSMASGNEYIKAHGEELKDRGYRLVNVEDNPQYTGEKKPSKEQDIHEDDDAQTNVAALAKRYIASGMDPQVAEKKAKEDLAAIEQVKDKENEEARARAMKEEQRRKEEEKRKEEERKREEEGRKTRALARKALVSIIAAGEFKSIYNNAVVLFKADEGIKVYGNDAMVISREVYGDEEKCKDVELYPEEGRGETVQDTDDGKTKVKYLSLPADDWDKVSDILTAKNYNAILANEENKNDLLIVTPSGKDVSGDLFANQNIAKTDGYENIQKDLLVRALEESQARGGIWINPDLKGAPELINDMKTLSPMNSIWMSLDSDRYRYKTPVYVEFGEAEKRDMSVKGRPKDAPLKHRLKLDWWKWGNTYNCKDDKSVINMEDYQNLPDERKKHYKRNGKNEAYPVFNIAETILEHTDKKDGRYSKYLREKGPSPKEIEGTVIRKITAAKEREPGYVYLADMDNVWKAFGKDAEDICKAVDVEGWTVPGPDGKPVPVVAFDKKDMSTVANLLVKKDYGVRLWDNAAHNVIISLKDNKNNINDALAFNNAVEKAKKVGKTAGFNVRLDISKPETTYNAATNTVEIGLEGADEPSLSSRERKLHDIIMTLSEAMGDKRRLNRDDKFSSIGADAGRMDRLVNELTAGYYLSRLGLSSKLSEQSDRLIPFWKQELAANDKLFSNIKRQVNTTAEVIDKSALGQKVDFVRIRGEYKDRTLDRLKKQNLTIIRGIGDQTVDTGREKRFAVIRDKDEKRAYVIMPKNASLDWGKPTPGLSLYGINDSLEAEGFERITFHSLTGSRSLPLVNDSFVEGVTASTAVLKNKKIANEKPIDIEALREKSRLVGVKSVKAVVKDKVWYLFVKDTDGKFAVVSPEKKDMNAYWSNLDKNRKPKNPDVTKSLGKKYLDMVKRNPSMNKDFITPKAAPETIAALKALMEAKKGDMGIKVSLYKGKNGVPYISLQRIDKDSRSLSGVRFTTVRDLPPRTVTGEQFSRMFLFDDEGNKGSLTRKGYNLLLGASIWEDVLSKSVSERQSQSQSQSADRQQRQNVPLVSRQEESKRSYRL